MSSLPVVQRRAAGASVRFAEPTFVHGLVVLVAVALLVRVIVVLANPHFVPRTDAADYDRIAVSLAQHNRFAPAVIVPSGGPSALRPPMFPLALAAVYKVVGVGSAATRWEAGRLFEAALGAIAVALICLIALRLWGRTAALVSGAIAAVYPPLVLVGSSLMTESLFVPLVLATVLAALVARDGVHRRRWEVVAGLLAGLTALTRSDGIALILPVLFLVWSARPRMSRCSLLSPLLVLAVALLTLVPWTVRNERDFHQFVPITTDGGYALVGTYNSYAQRRVDFPALWLAPVLPEAQVLIKSPRLNEAQVGDRLTSAALRYIGNHPASLPKTVYWNTLRLLDLTGNRMERYEARFVSYPLWLASLSVYTFWGVALLALGGLATKAWRTAPWSFWACPIVLFLCNPLFIGAARYRAPSDPFVVMLAALALIAGWRRLARTPRTTSTTLPGRIPSAVG